MSVMRTQNSVVDEVAVNLLKQRSAREKLVLQFSLHQTPQPSQEILSSQQQLRVQQQLAALHEQSSSTIPSVNGSDQIGDSCLCWAISKDRKPNRDLLRTLDKLSPDMVSDRSLLLPIFARGRGERLLCIMTEVTTH
jgi:hypothetical protein